MIEKNYRALLIGSALALCSLFLTACGGGDSGASATDPALDSSLDSGQLAPELSEQTLLQAALAETDAVARHLQPVKQQLFQLNSTGTTTQDSLLAISWNPTHDAITLQPTPGLNTPLLTSNAVTHTGYTVRREALAVIGKKAAGRYLVLGSSPFRNAALVNADMNRLMLNSLQWLSDRQDLAVSGATKPFQAVLSQLDNSYYFPDERSVRSWLDEQLSVPVQTNAYDACDGAALAGCLTPDTDLLVISQIAHDSDVDAIVAAVEKAQQLGIGVLYLHHDGNLRPLGERLLRERFDLSVIGDNYWRKLTINQLNPQQDLDYQPEHLQQIRDLLQGLDSGQAQLNDRFRAGLNAVKAELDGLGLQGKAIFDLPGYRLQKLLALIGDKFRQQVQYPMDFESTDRQVFLKSYYADHAVFYRRGVNPAQPDMGNFSRSDFSHVTPRTKTVSLTSRRWFRSAGVYALPGQPVIITRTDTSPLTVKVFINTLRPAATHELDKNGYTRPKYLQSPHFELKTGQPLTLTSPYGGPVQLEFSANDLPVTVRFDRVGEHPHWRGAADDARFANALARADYDWAEVATDGFEVHSKTDKMQRSVADPNWGTARAMAAATAEYTHNYPHVLAGFKGEGIDVVPEIHQFADLHGLTVETVDIVKHMNADQATCGYGCSGNPYDAYWNFSPIGHGDIHELGHGLESGRLRFEGWQVHASTNPYSYYSKSRFHQNTGGDPSCQSLPFQTMYETLQESRRSADPAGYLKTNLWDQSGWAEQFMVTLQAMMHAKAQGRLENGWHLLARLHLLDREVKRAKNDWLNRRADIGFSRYTLEEFNTMRGNDWLLVSFSWAAGLDYRDYFSMMGITYSQQAADQVAALGYTKAPMVFFASTGSGYCKSDRFGDYLAKTPLPVDGSSVWPVQ